MAAGSHLAYVTSPCLAEAWPSACGAAGGSANLTDLDVTKREKKEPRIMRSKWTFNNMFIENTGRENSEAEMFMLESAMQ